MLKTILTTACLAVQLGAWSAHCDWSSVNHDQLNSRSSPCTTITFHDIKQGQLVPQWNTTGGSVQAAPIVSDGVVYFGDSNGKLFAYNLTGTLLHQFTFPHTGEKMNGPVTVKDGIVYVTSVSDAASPQGGLRLYALDTTLAPIPSFNGGQPVDIHPGFTGAQGNILSGPVLINHLVIVGTTNATAEETLAMNPTYRGGLHAFHASTGAFEWRTIISPSGSGYGTSGGCWSTPAIDTKRGLLFVGTSNATTPPASPRTDALLAIDYKTGSVKWSQQYTPDDVYSFQYACGGDLDVGASPNLFSIKRGKKNVDVVGCGSKAGVYRVFERKSGKPVWDAQMIPAKGVPSIDGNPSAAYKDNKVYTIANLDTSGISYNAFSVLAQYGVAFGDFAPILQLINYLKTTDITYIRAINASTGKILWSNKRVSASLDAITEANGVLYTGNFIGEFRALNTKNGHEVLVDTVGGGLTIGAPITVVGNQVFIGLGIAGAGGLYVYHKP